MMRHIHFYKVTYTTSTSNLFIFINLFIYLYLNYSIFRVTVQFKSVLAALTDWCDVVIREVEKKEKSALSRYLHTCDFLFPERADADLGAFRI